VADLSFMYTCGKCSRNFANPDHLKHHEIPCRGKRPAGQAPVLPVRETEKNLAGHFPQARTIEFRRRPNTREL
jgi:hypothetical protein